jgi:hypothetical protein
MHPTVEIFRSYSVIQFLFNMVIAHILKSKNPRKPTGRPQAKLDIFKYFPTYISLAIFLLIMRYSALVFGLTGLASFISICKCDVPEILGHRGGPSWIMCMPPLSNSPVTRDCTNYIRCNTGTKPINTLCTVPGHFHLFALLPSN